MNRHSSNPTIRKVPVEIVGVVYEGQLRRCIRRHWLVRRLFKVWVFEVGWEESMSGGAQVDDAGAADWGAACFEAREEEVGEEEVCYVVYAPVAL